MPTTKPFTKPSIFVLAACIASAAGLGASIARADEPQAAKAEPLTFAAIDRNNDHRISKTEAGMYKYILDRFAYIDTDGDGFISQDELQATLTARVAD